MTRTSTEKDCLIRFRLRSLICYSLPPKYFWYLTLSTTTELIFEILKFIKITSTFLRQFLSFLSKLKWFGAASICFPTMLNYLISMKIGCTQQISFCRSKSIEDCSYSIFPPSFVISSKFSFTLIAVVNLMSLAVSRSSMEPWRRELSKCIPTSFGNMMLLCTKILSLKSFGPLNLPRKLQGFKNSIWKKRVKLSKKNWARRTDRMIDLRHYTRLFLSSFSVWILGWELIAFTCWKGLAKLCRKWRFSCLSCPFST